MTPRPPTATLRAAALPFILAAAAWALAAALRLRVVDQSTVGSDSLGPYLKALSLTPAAVRAGVLPRPPNPESGDLLWLSALPIVHLAHDLVGLFTLRFIAGALIAPLGLLAAWVWAAPPDHRRPTELLASRRPGQLAAGLAAGLVLAVDPGLADSLVSGARGYGAPELLALVTLALGFAVRGSRVWTLVAAAAWMVALDHHPLAVGMLLGLLPLAPDLWRTLGARGTASLVGLVVILALPRLLRLLVLARCGEDPLTCLAAVAQSNVDDGQSVLLHLRAALHDRFRVDLSELVALGLGLGLVLARPWRGIGAVGLGTLAGVLLVGGLNSYLQGYHLRIAAAPLAVAAAIGLARLWPLALVWAGVATALHLPERPQGTDPGAPSRHDALAAAITEQAGPWWVDRLWQRGQPVLDPSGVVLSAVLQGQEGARFQVGPEVPMLLLVVGEGCPAGRVLAQGRSEQTATDWAACTLSLAEGAAVRQAVTSAGPAQRAVQHGGAWDWVVSLQPGRTDSDAAAW